MDTHRILSDLRAERNRIDQAISALELLDRIGGRTARITRGRRGARTTQAGRLGGRRRRMSAAARKRISEMMKARWAERKRRAKA